MLFRSFQIPLHTEFLCIHSKETAIAALHRHLTCSFKARKIKSTAHRHRHNASLVACSNMLIHFEATKVWPGTAALSLSLFPHCASKKKACVWLTVIGEHACYFGPHQPIHRNTSANKGGALFQGASRDITFEPSRVPSSSSCFSYEKDEERREAQKLKSC